MTDVKKNDTKKAQPEFSCEATGCIPEPWTVARVISVGGGRKKPDRSIDKWNKASTVTAGNTDLPQKPRVEKKEAKPKTTPKTE